MPQIVETSTSGSPSTLTTYVDGTAVIQATASGVTVLGQTTVVGPVTNTGTAVTGPTTYTVSTTEARLDCTTTSGAVSIVLPAANGAGQANRSLPIVDVAGNAGTNNITITVTGGGTINGASSYVLNTNYGTVTVLSNGTAWLILTKQDLPTVTAAGRSIVSAANAAAQRTALGLGSAATATAGTSANNVLLLNASGQIVLPASIATTDGSTTLTATNAGIATTNSSMTIQSAGTINLTPASALQVGGAAGTSGYVLTSQGASLPPVWAAAPGAGGGGYATGVRQIVTSFIQSVASGTTVLPADNTIPQSTEGTQFITATITPQSTTSSLIIIATLSAMTPSVISTMTSALFRDSATGAFAAGAIGVSSTVTTAHTLMAVVSSGSLSATTFKLRAGLNVAGTLFVNGYAGPTTYYGGVCQSGLTIIEVGA